MNRAFSSTPLRLLVVIAGTTLSAGAIAATGTAESTATVVTPIAISKSADLSFGKFAAGTGGTVVMSPAGARSAGGSVVLLTGTAGNAASFSVTGDANATYSITLPETDSVTHTDGVTTMSLGSFTSNPSGTGTLSAGGAQTVNVGATLTVGSGQTAGVYSGDFDVTVEYN